MSKVRKVTNRSRSMLITFLSIVIILKSTFTDPFGDGCDRTLYLSVKGPNSEDVGSSILQVFYLE